MQYTIGSHRKIGARSATGRIAVLTSVCALAFGIVLSVPADMKSHGIALNSAQAASANSNAGGNGNGNGPEDAPGQIKQEESAAAENEAIDSVEGAAEGAVAESGEPTVDPLIIPIVEDAAAAEKKVIQEVAGLEEESELSEEEELEAIRSGWGTWRTADGPETVLSQ